MEADEFVRLQKQAYFHGVCRGMDVILERIEDVLERMEIIEQRAVLDELAALTELTVRILLVECGIESGGDEGEFDGK